MTYEVLLTWPAYGLVQENWDVSTTLCISEELRDWFRSHSIPDDWQPEGRSGAYLDVKSHEPVHFRKDTGLKFFFDDPKQAMLFKLAWA